MITGWTLGPPGDPPEIPIPATPFVKFFTFFIIKKERSYCPMCTDCGWSTRPQNDGLLIAFEGQIDFTNVGPLCDEVCNALAKTAFTMLVVDLSGVKFIDRIGLSLFFALRRTYALRIVVSTQSQPARIMQLGRFDLYFPGLEYRVAERELRAQLSAP